MSQLRVNEIVSENGTGAPSFPYGVTGISVSYADNAGIATYATTAGIATSAEGLETARTIGLSGDATGSGSFDGTGDLTIAVDVNTSTYADTAGIATNAQGLSGTPNITVGNVVAAAATFSGDVSIGGTLTYEDVSSIDSVGVITARQGIDVTSGGISLAGMLNEGVNIVASKVSDALNISLDDGMLHYFTTTETTTSAPNIRFDGSTTLDSSLSTGETVAVTIITTAAAAGYSTGLYVDSNLVTQNWVGGAAPTSGGASGLDIYTHQIIKTGSAAFTVISSVNNAA